MYEVWAINWEIKESEVCKVSRSGLKGCTLLEDYMNIEEKEAGITSSSTSSSS